MKHPTERDDVEIQPEFTETDVMVLRLIANGATNQVIADSLDVSTSTTGRQLTALFGKIGAKDRTHATAIALISRIIEISDVSLPTWAKNAL